MCGCGGGGAAARPVQVPRLQSRNMANVPTLHPSVLHMQNVQKLAEERRKVERLKREQLLKALSKP